MKGSQVIHSMVALGLAVTLLLAGCAKATPAPLPTPMPTPTPSPAPTPTPSPAPTPTPSPTPSTTGPYGELKIAVGTIGAEKWAPFKADNTGTGNMLAPMFDFLFWWEKRQLNPYLAERWEIAPDGLSWILYIRKGVKFHNGVELKADDMKFSIEQYMRPDAYNVTLRDLIDRVEKVDDYTVRVYTKGRQPFLGTSMMQGTPGLAVVVPKDYSQQGQAYFESHPVGTGAFKFVRHVLGDFVEYQAFEGYWGKAPAFKTLTLILMPEETTRIAALKTGMADLIDVSQEGARGLEAAGFRTPVVDNMVPMVQLHGAYDSRAAGMPITDIRVRQALSLAINRDEIRKNLFYGKAGPPMPLYCTETADEIDIAYWRDYSAKMYIYDPVKAKALLKEAGYPDGFTFKLYTFPSSGAPYLPKLAEVIQSYWKQIGVTAEMNLIDSSLYVSWRKGPAAPLVGQATTYRFFNASVSAKNVSAPLLSSGSTALLGKAFPEVDKLIDDTMSETDVKKREEMMAKAIKIGTDTWTVFQICAAPSMVVLGPKVELDYPTPLPSAYLPTYARMFIQRQK